MTSESIYVCKVEMNTFGRRVLLSGVYCSTLVYTVVCGTKIIKFEFVRSTFVRYPRIYLHNPGWMEAYIPRNMTTVAMNMIKS